LDLREQRKPIRPNTSSSEEYYRSVQSGYDLLAPSYDQDIGGNAVGIRMREIFRQSLRDVFPGGQRLFEIGCGSGIDSLWLAGLGFSIVATDISGKMIVEVDRKAKRDGLQSRIETQKLAAGEIGKLSERFGEGYFDGGFCHAGALNMEPALPKVVSQVASLIRPGGFFVCSIINKVSLFEVLFYLAVLRPRKAFRRLDNVVPIPISRVTPLNRFVVPTHFYSPNQIARLFGPAFSMLRIRGLEIFLPPSNLADYYQAARPLFLPLELLENRLSTKWPIHSWGHHTICILRRR